MPDAVRYAVAKRVAHIVLDRPPVNALSLDMIRAVIAALRRAAADDEARAVVLSSAVARHFCAGLDLAVLLGKSREEVREFVHALYVDLHECQFNLGKPSIAAVDGSARGGGMTMAISCDVIVASRGTRHSAIRKSVSACCRPFTSPICRASSAVTALSSCSSAAALSMRRKPSISALSARSLTMTELEPTATALAADFAAKSPTVMRAARSAFMRQNDDRRRIADAVEDFCNVVTTDAAQEGIRAFLEKRAPNW